MERRSGGIRVIAAGPDRPARFGIEQDLAHGLGFDDFHAEGRLRRGSRANGIEQAVVCPVVVRGLYLRFDTLFFGAAIRIAAGEELLDGRLGNVAGALIVGIARNETDLADLRGQSKLACLVEFDEQRNSFRDAAFFAAVGGPLNGLIHGENSDVLHNDFRPGRFNTGALILTHEQLHIDAIPRPEQTGRAFSASTLIV